MNRKKLIDISVEDAKIYGNLILVDNSPSLVIFVHGSGSSRFSTRNQFVAEMFNEAGISTLLFDLLTEEEEGIDQRTKEFRFDIPLLTDRLLLVTRWLTNDKDTADLAYGYFGSSTGAAAALIAAAKSPYLISAVVSRGGRVDLAETFLPEVQSATLLLVGEYDYEVLKLNQTAYQQLQGKKELFIVPHATHLFEEDGALTVVAELARDWFKKFLKKDPK